MVTKNDVFQFLKSCNIKHNDKIIIHSSLRAIGEIEAGANGLINFFCEYLSDGLLIVPTHTWDVTTKENPYYDVSKTQPCIGTLAKVAAFRTDAVRSLHPTHSIAVFGKNAIEFVKGEECCGSPAPVESCLNRLYEENGKILLVGVSHTKNTYLHAVDERLNLPNRLSSEPFIITIKDKYGNEMKSPPFHTHYTKGIPCCCSEFYDNYHDLFDYFGAVTYSQIGNARVLCCDARKMTDAIKLVWKKTDHDLCIYDEQVPRGYYEK